MVKGRYYVAVFIGAILRSPHLRQAKFYEAKKKQSGYKKTTICCREEQRTEEILFPGCYLRRRRSDEIMRISTDLTHFDEMRISWASSRYRYCSTSTEICKGWPLILRDLILKLIEFYVTNTH